MAQVTLIRAQPVQPPVEKVSLVLTPDEATRLYGLLYGLLCGEARTPYLSDIYRALRGAGVRSGAILADDVAGGPVVSQGIGST